MKKPKYFTEKSFNKDKLQGWTMAQFVERYKDQLDPDELTQAAHLIGIADAPAEANAIPQGKPAGGKKAIKEADEEEKAGS